MLQCFKRHAKKASIGWSFSLCNATTDVQLEPPLLHDDEAPTALAGFHHPLPAFSGVSPHRHSHSAT